MKIFLDTSSLIKLYNNEADTLTIQNILSQYASFTIVLSETAKVEFVSAILKKARMRSIAEIDAKAMITVFEADWYRYKFIEVNTALLNNARKLTLKYGLQGLRTLDSIQLAAAVSLKGDAALFITSDQLLQSFFVQEGLPV